MDSLADAVASSDSPWALGAIAIIGLYALLWRFGGKLLERLDQNTELTNEAALVGRQAKQVATDVQQAIQTNHGSKNIGDSIDRLTTWMVQHMDDSDHNQTALRSLEQAFIAKVIEGDQSRAQLVTRLEGFDVQHAETNTRLARIEKHLGIED